MTPFYSLWDIEVGTSLGTYETEGDVLAVVHQLLLANGANYADALEMGYQDNTGEWHPVATGVKLKESADRWTAAEAVRSSPVGVAPLG